MRVETCMLIEELGMRDVIRETYEGGFEDCLNWKRIKIEEFFDFVGKDHMESLGYNTKVFGSKLLKTEQDVMLTTVSSMNFLTVYFYGD